MELRHQTQWPLLYIPVFLGQFMGILYYFFYPYAAILGVVSGRLVLGMKMGLYAALWGTVAAKQALM
jgi:hypothetical protein